MECACIEAQREGDITGLVHLVRRGTGPHHQAVYLLEASLWSKAVPDDRWIRNLPKIASLARNRSVHPQSLGFLYTCARPWRPRSIRRSRWFTACEPWVRCSRTRTGS